MTAVGLENPSQLLERYPFEMSGGMLQRMMIALALLSKAPLSSPMNPPPTSMPWRRGAFWICWKIVSSRGQGLLLVTHDMGVVARLAHEVAGDGPRAHRRALRRHTLFSAPGIR